MNQFITDIKNGGYLTKEIFDEYIDYRKVQNVFSSTEFNEPLIKYITYNGINKKQVLDLCRTLEEYETTPPAIVDNEYFYKKVNDFFVTHSVYDTKHYVTRGTTIFVFQDGARMFVHPTNPDMDYFKSQSIEIK